ncbi:PLP-dependent transferase [Hypoxylon cercidicola]|nr:PLP-dependent transferase [Hypoxylon cercidicola]
MPETCRQLDHALGALLARRKSHGKLRKLSNTPPNSVDFSSNGYLSLSTNPVVQKSLLACLAAEVAASEDGNRSRGSRRSILGSGGSRLLDGNSPSAESLEPKIAAFHGAEAALLFTSAYDANSGLLGCVPQEGDVIVYDELIHASVHDGMRMSRATKKIPFAHDSMSDASRRRCAGAEGSQPGRQSKNRGLDDILRQTSESEYVRNGKSNVFICVEGLYSMDGDVVLLDEVVRSVDRHLPSGNGYIVVDEAHSVGIFGDDGRGLVCQLGLEDRVWARVLGFGKAMGCSGGAVLCSSTTRSYLINYARSLIYTTSMAFTSLASIDVVYRYLMDGGTGPLRQQLKKLIHYTHRQLSVLCARLQVDRRTLHIQEVPSKSPIIPVFTAYPRSLAEHCQRSGFMVRPIVAPTVPTGSERVRICLHSTNTTREVDGLCDAIGIWVQDRVTVGLARDSAEDHGVPEPQNVFGRNKPRL